MLTLMRYIVRNILVTTAWVIMYSFISKFSEPKDDPSGEARRRPQYLLKRDLEMGVYVGQG